MSNVLVDIQDLSRHFPARGGRVLRAVDNVSLTIAEREVVGLVGESGSGKSTLGKTMLGLWPKTAGSARYRGELLPAKYGAADFQRHAQRMQMIFQDPYSSLNPRMTVGEIIGEGLRLHTSLTRWDIDARVQDWLARVGLHPSHAGRYPHEFSGGQRQRIGIARALVMEPEFVVCDEPISALDVSVQAQVVNLLDELKRSLNLTLLFIAHDLSMVRYVSDRMAVMYLGALVEIGPADDVFFTPRHPYTQMLVAANPEPDPVSERARRSAPLTGEIPSPLQIGGGCRFATRCPQATAQCSAEVPAMRNVAGTAVQVACHLYPG